MHATTDTAYRCAMNRSSRLGSRSRVGLIYVGTLVAGGSIALSGLGKFTGHFWQPLFLAWGYPLWFCYLIGAAEIVASISLFVAPIATYAGVVLAAIMLGAFYTLVSHPTPQMGWSGRPLIYVAIIGLVIVLRWAREKDRAVA
jgi:uncharacterized membrane protein YphA (DoxX/SURF4 family)